MRFTSEWILDRQARQQAKLRSPQEFEPTDDEGELQEDIERECLNRGWLCFRSRMDKRQHGKIGTPDCVCATHTGHTIYCEAKSKGRKATPTQRATLVWLRQNKQIAVLVRSKEEFLKIAETYETDESLRKVEALFL